MSSLAGLFPAGFDLCSVPAGPPPSGEVVDFNDTGLRSLTISLSVILTTIASIFALGRLYNNLKRLSWSDLFVVLAMLLNIAEAVLMIIFLKTFRHMWDVPLCWLDGQFEMISYIWEIVNNFSLFFAKVATLLLFRQIFIISRQMRIAIWVGIAVTFVLYAATMSFMSYYAAPHIGQTWDELLAEVIGTIIYPLYGGVVQGAINTVLDVYIFILPLPLIYRLQLSTRKKIQVMAVFLTALLGVIASTISLVYRVKSIQGPNTDSTYNTGVLMICNLVEMNVAVIICSATAFAALIRTRVVQSQAFQSIRSTFRAGSQSESGRRNPFRSSFQRNRPASHAVREINFGGQMNGQPKPSGYVGMRDTWLLKTDASDDIEAQRSAPSPDDVRNKQDGPQHNTDELK